MTIDDVTSTLSTMYGQTVLVTGASSGMGRATAEALGQAGATVLAHARSRSRAEALVRGLSGRLVPVWGDLGSLAGVRTLVDQTRAAAPAGLNVLVNNAGAAFADRALSPEGIERTLAINHLAVAALTAGLLDSLRAAARSAARPARIVNVSSSMEKHGNPNLYDWAYGGSYRQFQAYCDSKLVNLAYTYTLARQVIDHGVCVNAVNPGGVATQFGRNAGGVFGIVQSAGRAFLKSPEKGAYLTIQLARDSVFDGATGGYYSSGQLAQSSPASRDPDFGRRVCKRTLDILQGSID